MPPKKNIKNSSCLCEEDAGEGVILNKIGELALNAIKALLPELVSKLGNLGVEKLSSVIKKKMEDHVEKTGSGIRILGETNKGNGNGDVVISNKSYSGSVSGSRLPRKKKDLKGSGVYQIMHGAGVTRPKNGGCLKASKTKENVGSGVQDIKVNLNNEKKDDVDIKNKKDFQKLYKRALNKVEKIVGHDETTWTSDLEEVIKKNKVLNKFFKGIFSYEDIKKIKSKAKKYRAILNTGGHWVLYIVENDKKYIYDPLGDVNKHMFQDSGYKVLSNKQIQCIESQNCGQHTITALYLINKYGLDVLENL